MSWPTWVSWITLLSWPTCVRMCLGVILLCLGLHYRNHIWSTYHLGLDYRCSENEPALRPRPQVLACTKCDVHIYLYTSLPCSFLSKTVVAIFQAVMVYRASALRGLAITQMVFAALMITFGAACIFSVDHWSSRVGFGVWVGSWVCIRDRALPLIIVLTFCVIIHYWYHFRF